MIERKFGVKPPLTLGVEEEIMILDPETFDQTPGVDRILAGFEGLDVPGRAKTELHASMFELNTEPIETAREALDALVTLRHVACEVATAAGLTIAAAGSHPFAKPEAQPVVKEERYVNFVGYAGVTARRQGVMGLHVHLSMPSADDCWRVLEGMLPWLPVVLAMSANSPWLAGVLTGMASNRAPRLAELPRAGAPPSFGSYAGWEAWVERLVALDVFEDATRIWWDVRPAPHLGTLEVRITDQPTDVRRSAALAALLQALGGTLLDGDDGSRLADRGDYLQNRWAAARFGPQGTLIHPDGQSAATASELARELIERVQPAAQRLGSADLLATLDPSTCEAELQARHTTPQEAAADLVERSLA